MATLMVFCRDGLLREGLIQLCRGCGDTSVRIEVRAASGDDSADAIGDDAADAVLLAVDTGGVGWDAVTGWRGRHPTLPLLVLGDRSDYDALRRALTAGARGYLDYRSCERRLGDALRTLLDGGVYAPPQATPAPPPGAPSLTPRQQDVLALLRSGRSNKEIARTLRLAEGTIKIHCMAIFRELGVANRTQAALRAEQLFG